MGHPDFHAFCGEFNRSERVLASGDNFGTNNVDPDQAQQSVKLIWIPSVRVRNSDTV